MSERTVLQDGQDNEIRFFDQATSSVQISDISPALQQGVGVVALSAVTATGASVSYNISQYNKGTLIVTASSVTSGGTIQLQGSYDNTNFGAIPLQFTPAVTGLAYATGTLTLSANGTYIIPFEIKTPYIRVNILTRTDGTYTASLYMGN